MNQKTMIFSTLFDSHYLDKGLVLIESMLENINKFRLYIVAFDDLCFKILSTIGDERIIVISLKEFETEELLNAKKNRSAREYCWTCSCFSIKYVLEKYRESICTYIDADMYFYQSPDSLFDEIYASGCDASVIRHGFYETKEKRKYLKMSGEYCVEFNTFFASENGMRILEWWCEQCLESCTENMDMIKFGDQKYIEQMVNLFSGIHVIENQGAGVAPWNLARFYLKNEEYGNSGIQLYERKSKKIWNLIFYHFQDISYVSNDKVDIGVYLYPGNVSLKLRNKIYYPYLKLIQEKRNELKHKFGLDLNKNQRYEMPKSVYSYMQIQIKFFKERDPVILLSNLFRIIAQKPKDYISLNGLCQSNNGGKQL